MAERSSLNQVIQIGVEATHGTAVAATARLQSISITPSMTVQKDNFRPMGQKFNALSTLGKEWVTAAITGRATYNELQYMLSGVIGTGTVTAPATGAYQWVFSPNSYLDDAPQTFTVEHGSSVHSDRFAYGLVTEMGVAFSRTAIEITGSMMGQALQDNVALTSTALLEQTLVPVIPTQVTCYLDDTFGALGTTKLTRLISGNFHLGSRFGPVWVLDAANPSFVNHVETAPDLTATLMLQANAEGMALLAPLRDGSTKFLRIEAIGAVIASTTATPAVPIPYRLTIDVAIKISATGGFSDSDGVYAVQFTGLGVHDAGWGKALQVTLVNTVATL